MSDSQSDDGDPDQTSDPIASVDPPLPAPDQTPDDISDWVATFRSLYEREAPDAPAGPRRYSLDAMQLAPMEVELPRIIRVLYLEDISDTEPDYL